MTQLLFTAFQGGLQMNKYVLVSMTVSFSVVVSVAPADELKSGLQVGEMATKPFTVQDITGPKKGASLCYR